MDKQKLVGLAKQLEALAIEDEDRDCIESTLLTIHVHKGVGTSAGISRFHSHSYKGVDYDWENVPSKRLDETIDGVWLECRHYKAVPKKGDKSE